MEDAPFTTIGTEGGEGYAYDEDHNVLFITPYSHADFDTQRIFIHVNGENAAMLHYNELLFGFFCAHQMMHILYNRLQLDPVSDYEEELRINALTWSFLREQNLVAGRDDAWAAMLQRMQSRLEPRYSFKDQEPNASEIVVIDNHSYWYVTATNLLEARGLARSATNTGDLIGQMKAQAPATVSR